MAAGWRAASITTRTAAEASSVSAISAVLGRPGSGLRATATPEATGAHWIQSHWKRFGDGAQLVRDYIDQAQTNQPVHSWRDPGA